jgi:hypothetical protein
VSTKEVLSDLGVQWECTAVATTKRGKQKPVVIGIPTSLFWYRRKHGHIPQAAFNGANCTLSKLDDKWQVTLWLNRQNIVAAQETAGAKLQCDLIEVMHRVVEADALQAQPF